MTRVPIVTLLASNALSITGNVMTHVAVPWFVLQTTGSPARTGVAGFFQFLPVVIAGFFGGTLVDRLGHRRMSVFSDIASGVTVAAIPLLYATVGIEFWQLLALVFLGTLLDTPGETARSALIPEAAERAGWSLERASGANAVVERSARLAGAPLAGILIATVGATNVLWVDAATFLISAIAIRIGLPIAHGHVGERLGYLHELRDGLRYLRRERVLLAIMLIVAVTNFLDAATMILLPVYADAIYGSPVSLGLMVGALGGGSVVAALLFAARGHLASRRKLFAACFMGVTIRYPVLALFPSLGVAVAGEALAGAASGPLNPIIDTVKYERVPVHMRGRVFGVVGAVAWAALPLGILLGGFFIEWVGLRAALILIGIAYLATTLTLWFIPALRDMDSSSESRTLVTSSGPAKLRELAGSLDGHGRQESGDE